MAESRGRYAENFTMFEPQSALLSLLLLGAGLALLLYSAKHFIEGIAFFAETFGVPPLIVGMTVVAFGTSTPELVVNTLSAYRGETGLAFGNIVGSCAINVGFVLAVTALVRPLHVEPSIITREIPMLMVSVAALFVLGNDARWDVGATNQFGRGDGLILLLLFGIFLYYTAIYSVAQQVLTRSPKDAFMQEIAAEHEPLKKQSLLRPALITLLGLGGVSLGADWTVAGASALARLAGVPENVIGLTIVSVGTTLPELVTCVLAARRGSADIALGNIVGSNLFNILAIGGTVSTVRPVPVPAGGQIDIALMALLSAILIPITIRSGRRITRGEGAFLLTIYATYIAYRLLTL